MLCSVLLAAPLAQAESLLDALREAYRSSPELQAERARQRATDENVPAAKSGWRPTITTQGQIRRTWADNTVSHATDNTSKTISIQLSQPLFRGFKTIEGTKQAEANVQAGRQQLLATEQSVLYDAVTAYANVLRYRQLYKLAQNNVSNLSKQARATRTRFDVGEVTRTDVSQAQARVRGAEASMASAKANLESAIASYEQVTGKTPGKLKSAKVAKVPSSLDQAYGIAQETNPSILAAAYVHEASLHSVEVAKGDLLPSASLNAAASTTEDPAEGVENSKSAYVEGVVTVPIYQSGREYAAVRQAKQVASQRQIEIINATRKVREQVRSAWYSLIASRQAIVSAKAQVSAAAQALDGVNQEYVVGSRSTIDVLNAEQELVSAKNGLVNAQYNEVAASYLLLSAIGRLTARNLGVDGPYYDPEDNYNATKGKFIGLSVDVVE